MKSKSDSMQWIPLWVDKWIFGSTRIELQPDERSVWTDFMALAAKDNGWIRANPETGYLPTQLAGMLCISEELLERSIKRFLDTGKIKTDTNSAGYYIINWQDYTLSDDYKKRINRLGRDYFKKGSPGYGWDSDNPGMDSQNGVTRVEYSRVEKSIVKESPERKDFVSCLKENPVSA